MLNFRSLVQIFFSFLLIAMAPQVKSQNDIAWDKMQGLGHVEYFEAINPKKRNDKKAYHIFVRLPDEYSGSPKQTFPVLYLLDGGTNFPLFAASYTHLRWMEDIPPMILVGISYGTHDWRKGNDRSHDFTAPSSERDHWGGAKVFEQFFIEGLMPIIQQKYRVDADKQILFGQSLGGQFGLYSSMYGEAPFYGIIASNPALHRNLAFFKQPMKTRSNRPKVFVSIAEFDGKQYKVPAEDWTEYWRKQSANWDYHFTTIDGHNHLSATPDVIRNGLIWLLSDKSD